MKNSVKRSWLKPLPLLLVLLLVMNPEIRAFGFLADMIGFDLLALLFAIQIRCNAKTFAELVLKPAYLALCYFAPRSFIPTGETVRTMPSLLLHALPIMPLYILSATGIYIAQSYFNIFV